MEGGDSGLADYRQIFVERSHFLDSASFERFVELAKQTDQSIEALLIEKAFISQSQYLQLAGEYFELPTTALEIGEVNLEALKFLDAEAALDNLAIPFDINENEVKIAVTNPHSDELGHRLYNSQLDIKYYVSTEQAIKRSLILYDPSIEETLEKMSHYHGREGQEDNAPATELGLSIIETAVMYGASDVHIEPYEDTILVRQRIDGILHIISNLPTQFYGSLVAYYKIQANLRIDEHRLPQDGRLSLKIKKQEVNVRMSLVPSLWGEKIVMRILPKEAHLFDLNTIGLLDSDLELVKRNLKKPFGMILVSGPTGSGKTTSLYAFLQEIGAEKTNIVNISTIEDPIEYTIPRVTQIQTQPDIDLTFASGLRALLRQDPDILMVGEIRDEETADISIRTALVGRLVLSSIHTNDAVGVIPRLLDMDIEPYLVASTLALVAAQRLARKLCTYCRQSYQLDDEAIEKLNVHRDFEQSLQHLHKLGVIGNANYQELRFFKAVGCTRCNDTGYNGRVGLYEMLEINNQIRGLISRRADTSTLKQAAIENGMKTMFDDGLAKATLGIIDLDELIRVVYE